MTVRTLRQQLLGGHDRQWRAPAASQLGVHRPEAEREAEEGHEPADDAVHAADPEGWQAEPAVESRADLGHEEWEQAQEDGADKERGRDPRGLAVLSPGPPGVPGHRLPDSPDDRRVEAWAAPGHLPARCCAEGCPQVGAQARARRHAEPAGPRRTTAGWAPGGRRLRRPGLSRPSERRSSPRSRAAATTPPRTRPPRAPATRAPATD